MADYVEGLDPASPALSAQIAATGAQKLQEIQRCVINSLPYANLGRFEGINFVSNTSDPASPLDGLLWYSAGYTSAYPVFGGGNQLTQGFWLFSAGQWYPVSNTASYQVGALVNGQNGQITNGPPGWSCTRISEGQYRVTHNLNLTNYGIHVTPEVRASVDTPALYGYFNKAATTFDMSFLRVDTLVGTDPDEISILLSVIA